MTSWLALLSPAFPLSPHRLRILCTTMGSWRKAMMERLPLQCGHPPQLPLQCRQGRTRRPTAMEDRYAVASKRIAYDLCLLVGALWVR